MKLEKLTIDLEKILLKLEEVLSLEKLEINRDSAIKRFEIAFDIAWKTLKTYLEEKYGIICKSPKGCIREAFTQGLIEYDDYWLKIVDLRNSTAYIYSEYMADEVYEELPKVLLYLKTLYNKMRE
ncbi:MAG TPA: nucleotidyltransferase [Sulfurihydrogenibium sp.]|uniref:HI0074 family nucleotidyltransferase substrate-binding subunit n=1 Tax=Sulfurihydrogenibium sp. (strain YO3AOP1) TaxID=436114 RepID=UPI0001726A7E|nr:HI0074 family nucleotidyltransferase substrate-binding subunit [Sulfurihydrogenibium sp. YO3AOP1]ACD67167.1 nucleotidyltransferase substrate binding protein, HI0074 family [Sulfurihydrogenibium sp. YO3AOP1]HBT98371.1 nucleotidyltransferase [Sulfurihydrogenibium sp.]